MAAPPRPTPVAGDDARIEALVRAFIAGEKDPKTAVNPGTKAIDAAVDRALIYSVFSGLGRKLADRERILARETFRKELGF
jgi:hypothetical protein